MHTCGRLCLFAFLALLPISIEAQELRRAPLPVEQSLQALRLPEGLQVELVAQEPQVVDPVAVRFDARGRMWVVEMRDYPHGPEPGEEPQSRIKLLEDLDGDGRFEKATLFADRLLFANGIQPWRDGVIVTMAGRVAFLQDTDGDGRADHDETWYRGFAEENSQLRANHPTLGLDQQVYVANGLRGGEVINARLDGAQPLPLRGFDFRFDPLTGDCQSVSGVGQFGLTFDDFGHRFVCSNRNPVKHIVLPNRFLNRNPRAAISAVAHDVAAFGEQSRIYPISRAWTTSTLHAGQFTAACGVTIYRGDALPDLRQAALTCDPTGNLVHREIMKDDGATFQSRPAREGVEFLASSDEWFRPVNMENGPDGALYVVDMCRAVIEHPQFMPTELKTRRDLLWGNDAGRIYRIVSQSSRPRKIEALDQQSSRQLVDLLSHSNAWHHETAARLLLERQDKSVQSDLQQAARQAESAVGRVRALWALKGLGVLQADLVLQALEDEQPRVREQAVRLCEPWADKPLVRQAVLKLVQDPDPKVRFSAALVMAPADRGEADAVAQLARRAGADPWMHRAVLLAAGDSAGEVLRRCAEQNQTDRQLLQQLSALAGATSDEASIAVLRTEFDQSTRVSVVLGLSEGLSRRRLTLNKLLDKHNAQSAVEPTLQFAAEQLERLADDPAASVDDESDAIQLLGLVDAHGDVLLRLAEALRQPPARRVAAISALARQSDIEPWGQLLQLFSSSLPQIRRAILDGALARTDRTRLLIEQMESGAISPREFDPIRSQRLQKVGDAELKRRAAKLLASAVPEDRQVVLARYQKQMGELTGDPSKGKQVFRLNCATCHRISDVGVDVAPDIADSRTKQPAQILADILQPNRAIDSDYVAYMVRTEDGQTLSGILVAETATSITLKLPEAKTITLLRSEIDQLKSSGLSLMPVGLEKNVSPQDMANLVAFIKNWRYLDGRTPLDEAANP